MVVECINDSNKPSDFPASKWIKKGKEYTVIRRIKSITQGIWCYELAEFNLDGLMYIGYNEVRFKIVQTNEFDLAWKEVEENFMEEENFVEQEK